MKSKRTGVGSIILYVLAVAKGQSNWLHTVGIETRPNLTQYNTR